MTGIDPNPADLDPILAALGPEPDTTDPDLIAEWRAAWDGPETLDQLDWCARKLARVRRIQAEKELAARVEIDRIEAWRAAEIARLDADREYFESQIARWHRAALDADPQAKTVTLPSGAVSAMRRGGLSVHVEDPTAVVAWLEEHAPECVEYPDPKVSKGKVAELFGLKAKGETDAGEYPAFDSESGEIVPGVTIVRGETSHKVDTPNTDY